MQKNDQAFGVIPLRQNHGKIELLLVHHQKGHWAFPKGHAEKNEMPLETATRELAEEVHLEVSKLLDTPPLIEHYTFNENQTTINKEVHYFIAFVTGDLVCQKEEIREAKWCTFDQAKKQATFSETRSLVDQVIEKLS